MMRFAIVALVACGGKAPPPQQPVANVAPAGSAAPPAPPESPGLDAMVCERRDGGFGPVKLTLDEMSKRRGTGVKMFADITSTKAMPIEVCSVPGEYAWLSSVTCKDGSKGQAQRSGSVGSGGTCGSIIDAYEVTCPEKTYEVFMDMYMCGPSESFR